MADTFKVVSRWSDNDINELLSAGAQSIGARSATDAGRSWSRPTDHPDPIVLAGGIPDDTVLPTADLVEGFSSAIKNHAADALMYGGWYGYEGCRQAIADRQNRIEGTTLEADNIIMHNGSSGCLENVLKASSNQATLLSLNHLVSQVLSGQSKAFKRKSLRYP